MPTVFLILAALIVAASIINHRRKNRKIELKARSSARLEKLSSYLHETSEIEKRLAFLQSAKSQLEVEHYLELQPGQEHNETHLQKIADIEQEISELDLRLSALRSKLSKASGPDVVVAQD